VVIFDDKAHLVVEDEAQRQPRDGQVHRIGSLPKFALDRTPEQGVRVTELSAHLESQSISIPATSRLKSDHCLSYGAAVVARCGPGNVSDITDARRRDREGKAAVEVDSVVEKCARQWPEIESWIGIGVALVNEQILAPETPETCNE
jgi:hypothetical protein